jgi:serine/threonine-protein kinase SRPK3
MLDKLAFGMSKIDGEGSKPGSAGSAGAVAMSRETRSEVKERSGGVKDIGGGGGGGGSDDKDEAAERLSNMSIDSNGFDKKSKPRPTNPPGPSLLTQMAPSHTGTTIASSTAAPSSTSIAPSESTGATSDIPLSTSIMSVDSIPSQSFGDGTSSPILLEGNERITVKIADLGNGRSPHSVFNSGCKTLADCSVRSYLD